MADRCDYYYLQLLQEDELDLGFNGLEVADRLMQTDQFPSGINVGLSVAQSSSPALTVSVDQGVAHDQTGQRMSVPSAQTLSLAADSSSATTAVTTLGNSKIVSVFLKFARNNYSPYQDGNSLPGFFRHDESFVLYVTQGAEALTPSAPALIADGILLADITRAYGQTQILNADISTVRRQRAYKVTSTPRSLDRGTPLLALTDLLGFHNEHVIGSSDAHSAGDIVLAVAQTWKDGSSFAATNVDAGFEELLTTLKSASTGTSGAHKTGCAAIVGTSGTIVAGSTYSVLTALKSATSIDKAAGPAWADATTNPAANASAFIDAMITRLASQAASPGAQAIGMHTIGNFAAGNVYSAIGEIAATTANADGAKHVGAEVKGSFLTNTVRAQLDELDTGWGKLARANAWTATQTFSGAALSGSTTWLALASRTVTKQQELKLSTVVLDVGISSDTPSAYIGAPPDPGGGYFATTSIGGLTVASEAIVGARGNNAAQSSYFVIELPDTPDGSVLASVTLATRAAGGGGGTLAKYTIVSWIAGGVLTALSTVDVVDTHTDPGTWTTTITNQVLTPTGTVTIDNSTTKYGVLVKNAFAGGIPDGVLIFGVKAAFTVTSQRS